MLKAYMVYPGDNIQEMGCLLVFAHGRNAARLLGFHEFPSECAYIEFNAIRKPEFDIYVRLDTDTPYSIDTNDELPEGAPPFYTEED